MVEHGLDLADATEGAGRLLADRGIVAVFAEEFPVEGQRFAQQALADRAHPRDVGQLFLTDLGQHLVDGRTRLAEVRLGPSPMEIRLAATGLRAVEGVAEPSVVPQAAAGQGHQGGDDDRQQRRVGRFATGPTGRRSQTGTGGPSPDGVPGIAQVVGRSAAVESSRATESARSSFRTAFTSRYSTVRSREIVARFRSVLRGKPSLVKVGRFDPDKNWLQAIDAVAELRAMNYEPQLIVRGGR